MFTPYTMRLVVLVLISQRMSDINGQVYGIEWINPLTIIIVGCVTRDMVGVCLIVVFSLLQTLIDIYRESGNIIIVTS